MMEKTVLNMSIIAGNIHQLRQTTNLTQKELAKALHVSIKSISAWELGKTYPNLLNVLNICNFFQIKVDALIGNPVMKVS